MNFHIDVCFLFLGPKPCDHVCVCVSWLCYSGEGQNGKLVPTSVKRAISLAHTIKNSRIFYLNNSMPSTFSNNAMPHLLEAICIIDGRGRGDLAVCQRPISLTRSEWGQTHRNHTGIGEWQFPQRKQIVLLCLLCDCQEDSNPADYVLCASNMGSHIAL